MYVAIRIRGTVNLAPKLKKALEVLNVRRINNASLWKEDPQSLKMIKAVQDYVAYGKLSESVLKELIEKKAVPLKAGDKVDSKKTIENLKQGKTLAQAGIRNLFNLSPPKGGFGKAGVKVPSRLGGALGDRKEEINDLVERIL